MKKVFLLLLCLAALAMPGRAQGYKSVAKPNSFEKKAIENVRQRYAEMKKMIDMMGEGADWQDRAEDADSPGGWPPEYFHVKVVQNLPGTGYHEENVRMFYEEERSGEDEVYPPLRLAYASSKYNFAAREFYHEFLYDEKGDLIFLYGQVPDTERGVVLLLRFYIKDSKVVWTMVSERSLQDDSVTEVYADSALLQEYREYLDSFCDYSNRIRTLSAAVDGARRM